MGTELNATITKRIEVAPGLVILRIEPDGWELPEFVPGQFAVLGLPGSANRIWVSDEEEKKPDPNKLIRRAYSISSSSKEKEYLEVYITLVRSGTLTPRIFNLREGGKLFLNKKFTGVFTLQQVPDNFNLILIATGTGIAPYISMIRTIFKDNPKRHFAMLHGAKHSWDLGYRAELETLAYYTDNFTYIPSISRSKNETEKWNGQTGHVQDVWKSGKIEQDWGKKPTPENSHIFLCGSPGMIEGMLTLLTDDGYKEHSKKEPGQIHYEKFW